MGFWEGGRGKGEQVYFIAGSLAGDSFRDSSPRQILVVVKFAPLSVYRYHFPALMASPTHRCDACCPAGCQNSQEYFFNIHASRRPGSTPHLCRVVTTYVLILFARVSNLVTHVPLRKFSRPLIHISLWQFTRMAHVTQRPCSMLYALWPRLDCENSIKWPAFSRVITLYTLRCSIVACSLLYLYLVYPNLKTNNNLVL